MNFSSRLRPWHVAGVVIFLCATVIGGLLWWRSSRTLGAVALVECLPPDQAAHVYLNVAALRDGGILDLLAGSKAAEEPDYRQFVDQTGFDYRTDLDEVAMAFVHGSVYLAVRGHFDWKKLNAYAAAQGGFCRNTVCEMPANEPDRHISFYPIRANIMALAFSYEERGVTMIGPSQWAHPPELPPDPVWISAPAFVFADARSLPEGTHAFLSPLARAQRTIFAIGPDGNQLRIRADVQCASAEDAATLTKQLTDSTDLLQKMLARDHMTPNPNDLSSVLSAGRFEQKDKRVVASWPVDRSFISALASGQ